MKNLKSFDQMFESKKEPKARAAVFSIDDEKKYKGWTFDDDWNGWACPYFEKKEADAIMKDFKGKFDKKKNAYLFNPEGDGDKVPLADWDVYEMQVIDTPDGKKEVWAIGAWAWVWSESK